MIKTLVFPAFRRDGRAVQLTEIISMIPENDLVWSILEFNGIGEAPNEISMDEFENIVKNKQSGIVMSWRELKFFSNKIYQVIDCIIVGGKDLHCFHLQKNEDLFTRCDIFLNVFDSTEWSVWARDINIMKDFQNFTKSLTGPHKDGT